LGNRHLTRLLFRDGRVQLRLHHLEPLCQRLVLISQMHDVYDRDPCGDPHQQDVQKHNDNPSHGDLVSIEINT
jgi:hypothetical protein